MKCMTCQSEQVETYGEIKTLYLEDHRALRIQKYQCHACQTHFEEHAKLTYVVESSMLEKIYW